MMTQFAGSGLEATVRQLRSLIEAHGFPPGSALTADAVVVRYGVDQAVAKDALQRLLTDGLLEATVPGEYRVSSADAERRRDMTARIAPVLEAMAQIAAARATPTEVAAMTLARDRMDRAIAVLDSGARAQAYRDFITLWAAATANDFYVAVVATLLREGDAMIDALTEIDLEIYSTNSEGGELRRLVEAIGAGDVFAATQAAQDHAIIIARRVDGLDLVPINGSGSAPASPDPAPLG